MQINRPNPNPHGTINFAPKKFLKKIPNIDIMIEFFTSKGKYYCPPQRDLSTQFVKDILSGKKALLKMADVKFVKNVNILIFSFNSSRFLYGKNLQHNSFGTL